MEGPSTSCSRGAWGYGFWCKYHVCGFQVHWLEYTDFHQISTASFLWVYKSMFFHGGPQMSCLAEAISRERHHLQLYPCCLHLVAPSSSFKVCVRFSHMRNVWKTVFATCPRVAWNLLCSSARLQIHGVAQTVLKLKILLPSLTSWWRYSLFPFPACTDL